MSSWKKEQGDTPKTAHIFKKVDTDRLTSPEIIHLHNPISLLII